MTLTAAAVAGSGSVAPHRGDGGIVRRRLRLVSLVGGRSGGRGGLVFGVLLLVECGVFIGGRGLLLQFYVG